MKKVFVGFLLLILLCGGYWYYHHHTQGASPASNMRQKSVVQVASVHQHNIPLQVTAMGQILAPQTIMLRAKQPGDIVEINFISGQKVEKGQLLLKVDNATELADLENAKADYKAKLINYNRYKRAAKISSSAVNPMDKTIAKGALEQARATLAAKQKAFNDTVILAPFSGRIGKLQIVTNSDVVSAAGQSTQIAIGAYVQIGTAIAVLSNDEKMLVDYSVPQKLSSRLKIGQPVTISLSAYPHKVFEGKVFYISPTINTATQTFDVRAVMDNKNGKLKSGMQGFVTHVLVPERKVLSVPGLSLVPSISGYSVYVVEKGKVKALPVVIGSRYGTYVEIKSGLKSGDKIIVSGVQAVHPGMAVKVKSQ